VSIRVALGFAGVVCATVVMLIRVRREAGRQDGERRAIAIGAAAAFVSAVLIVPKVWFILVPGALLLARNGVRLHRAIRHADGQR
jgi:uncharacterized membrane protein YfcA